MSAQAEANRRWRERSGARSISCEAKGCTHSTLRLRDREGTYLCPKHRAEPPIALKTRRGWGKPRQAGHAPGRTRASGMCGRNLHPQTPENILLIQRADGRLERRCRPCRNAVTWRYRQRQRANGRRAVVPCLVKGCDCTTERIADPRTGYLCPAHRSKPPRWVYRLPPEQQAALGIALGSTLRRAA